MANTGAKRTDEHRLECAGYAISSGKGIADAAGGLGIGQGTPRRRVQRRRGQADGTLPAREEDAEMRALGKRVRGLEMENRLLKEAGAFFAASPALGAPRAPSPTTPRSSARTSRPSAG